MAEALFDLPTSAGDRMKTLEQSHRIVEFTPNAQAALAYRIAIPNDWGAETELGSYVEAAGAVNLIGLFAPKAAPSGTFVAVSVARLPVEINVEDWTDHICAQDGWEVFTTRWLKTPNGLVADSGAIRGAAPDRDVMRIMGFADGGRVFMVSGVANERLWGKEKLDLLIACSSFELVAPTGSDSFEPVKEWEGGEPAFGVAFPGTWTLELQAPSKPGKSAVNIRLSDGQQLLGYILMKATSRQQYPEVSEEALLAESLVELRKAGFDHASEPIRLAQDMVKDTTPGYLSTYCLSGQMGHDAVDIRTGYRMLPELALSITLMSVAQIANPLLWMRCKRAFELVAHLNWSTNRM